MVIGYLLLACAEPAQPSCDLRSTVPSYEPACEDALLVLWPDESRLRVDGRVEALLPPDPQEDTTYGGTSGNPLTLLLDEELADSQMTTLTLGPGRETARLDAALDSGNIWGVVRLETVEGE